MPPKSKPKHPTMIPSRFKQFILALTLNNFALLNSLSMHQALTLNNQLTSRSLKKTIPKKLIFQTNVLMYQLVITPH